MNVAHSLHRLWWHQVIIKERSNEFATQRSNDMKAKMSKKPPEASKYLCTHCNHQFSYKGGRLSCPSCGSTDKVDFVPIDVLDDPEEDSLYTADDFHGG